MDSCYHGLIRQGGVTSYFKGCESSLQCLSQCSSEVCDLACCAGDMCNNASAPGSVPVPTEAPFQCYSCMSMESWGDCERQQALVTCDVDSVPKCLKMFKELSNGNKFYMRLCSSRDSCNRTLCGDAEECELHCCDNKDCETKKPRTSPPPTTLDCLGCHGNGSWAECEKQSACSAGFARCREVYEKFRGKDGRGCYTERECRSLQEDCRKNGGNAECQDHCCIQHLCTAAVARATSLRAGLLISACAVMLLSFVL